MHLLILFTINQRLCFSKRFQDRVSQYVRHHFAILVVAALATWVVPGGEYVERDGGMEFVPVVSVPQTWQLMSALFEGFTRQAGIIVFILIIGGAFWIVNSVRAVDAGIFSFLRFARGLERYAPLRRLGVHNLIMYW